MRKSPHMRNLLIISGFLAILTLASYWQVFSFDFVDYDDKDYVTNNLYVKTGLTVSSVAWAFTTSHAANWHPLTWLSHMLDCQIFGLNPMGHHLTNLIFHILNTILLFYAIYRITGLPWRSGFIAALFAIHPLHIQSVAWVAERKDVLSTFFLLLTVLAYIRYTEQASLKRYSLVLLVFAMGLMSKPMLVTLPLLLLLLDYWPLNRYAVTQNEQTPNRTTLFWRFAKEKAPLLIIVVISCIITFIVQRKGGAVNQFDTLPLGIRAANSFVSYIAYICKMIWPKDLCVLYPHPLNTLPVWKVIGSAMLFAGITYFAIRKARRFPYITVGWLWYVITLIPVIGIIQVGEQAMADRYTYVPLIGIFIIIAWAVPDLLNKRLQHSICANGVIALIAVIIIMALSVSTWYQLKPWQNPISLYEQALKYDSRNASVQRFLVNKLLEHGKSDDAIALLNKAIQNGYNKAEAHDGIGLILVKQGKIEEAISHYKIAMRLKPKMSEPYNNMGTALARLNRYDEAVSHLRKAIRLSPDYEEAHYNLAVVLSRQGHIKEAITHYNKSIQIKPSLMAHCRLGMLLMKQGKIDESISHFRNAIRINSSSISGHTLLAIALFHKGDYEGSWQEIHIVRKLGGDHPQLVADLLKKMPEPK